MNHSVTSYSHRLFHFGFSECEWTCHQKFYFRWKNSTQCVLAGVVSSPHGSDYKNSFINIVIFFDANWVWNSFCDSTSDTFDHFLLFAFSSLSCAHMICVSKLAHMFCCRLYYISASSSSFVFVFERLICFSCVVFITFCNEIQPNMNWGCLQSVYFVIIKYS